MFCISAFNVISEWVVTKSSDNTVNRDTLTDFTVVTWDQSTIEYDHGRKTFWDT
jgi:hypothetical protein